MLCAPAHNLVRQGRVYGERGSELGRRKGPLFVSVWGFGLGTVWLNVVASWLEMCRKMYVRYMNKLWCHFWSEYLGNVPEIDHR